METFTRPLFACVTENRDDWFRKAHNLVLSIRRFGGSLAEAPIVVYFVEEVRPEFKRTLTDLGADVRTVESYDSRYSFSNKLRMLELFDHDRFDALIALDADVVVTGDLAPYLYDDAIAIVPEGRDHLSGEQWRAIYGLFDLPMPDRDCVMRTTAEVTYPYYNTGVMSIPRDLCGPLLTAWTSVLENFDRVHRRFPRLVHENQIAFALAVRASGLPLRELPANLNLSTGVRVARRFAKELVPPFVVHYHHAVDGDGFILASRNRGASRSIDAFNRVRAEELGLEYGGLQRVPFVRRLQKSASMRNWYESPALKRARHSRLGVLVKRATAPTLERS